MPSADTGNSLPLYGVLREYQSAVPSSGRDHTCIGLLHVWSGHQCLQVRAHSGKVAHQAAVKSITDS